MKILVCGKGGCGKNVVATLIAKELTNRGKKVLVVDIDESNFGIYRNFGVEQPKDLIDYLGGKDKVRSELLKFLQGGEERVKLFDELRFDDLPEDYVMTKDGTRIIAIGKIHDFGEGCACLMGAVAEPSYESIMLAEEIVELSRKIGKKTIVVANKVDEKTSGFIKADAFSPLRRYLTLA